VIELAGGGDPDSVVNLRIPDASAAFLLSSEQYSRQLYRQEWATPVSETVEAYATRHTRYPGNQGKRANLSRSENRCRAAEQRAKGFRASDGRRWRTIRRCEINRGRAGNGTVGQGDRFVIFLQVISGISPGQRHNQKSASRREMVA
jgi:hypothetical protein